MDWKHVEQEINKSASTLLQNRSSSKSIVPKLFDVRHCESENTLNQEFGTEYLIKTVHMQQQQISKLELSMQSLIKSGPLNSNIKSDPMEPLIRRMILIENSHAEMNEKYASKDALLELLNGTMDQIRECNRCNDVCNQGVKSVSNFADSMLQALLDLSNSDQSNEYKRKRSNIKLDLLLNLNDSNNTALVNIIKESIQDAIEQQMEKHKNILLRNVKPLIQENAEHTESIIRELQHHTSSQVSLLSNKVDHNIEHLNQLNSIIEHQFQVFNYGIRCIIRNI